MTFRFGDYSVTTWGAYPTSLAYDDGGLQLWKATDCDGAAFFTAPRDAEVWYLAVIGAALLGRSVNGNAADMLTALDGVPRRERVTSAPAG